MKSFKHYMKSKLTKYQKVEIGFLTKKNPKKPDKKEEEPKKKIEEGVLNKAFSIIRGHTPEQPLLRSFEPTILGREHVQDLTKRLINHYNPDRLSSEEHKSIRHYTDEGAWHLNAHLYNPPKQWDDHNRYTEEKHSIEHISRGLRKYETPGELIVHSGIRYDPYHLRRHDDGLHKVQSPGFVSTTINFNTAKGFGIFIDTKDRKYRYSHNMTEAPPHIQELMEKRERGQGMTEELEKAVKKHTGRHFGQNVHLRNRFKHILQIHIPRGSHGLFVHPISEHEHEKEFILPKDSKFHIHPEPTVHEMPDIFGNRDHHLIWNARLVHDGTKDV